MMRNVFLGAVSGLVLSAVVLGTLSLVVPQPAGNRPPEPPATDAPAPNVTDAPAESTAAEVAAVTDTAASGTALPELGLPADSGAPEADTEPPGTPEIGAGTELLAGPGNDDGARLPAAPDAEGAVTLVPTGPAPSQPVLEDMPETAGIAAPVNPAIAGTPSLAPPASGDAAPDPAAFMADVVTQDAAPARPAVMPETEAPRPEADAPTAPEAALDLAPPIHSAEGEGTALTETGPDDPVTTGIVPAPAPLAGVADVLPDTAPAPEPPASPPSSTATARSPAIALQGDGTARLPGGDTGVTIRRPGDDDDGAAGDDEAEPAPHLPPLWQAAAAFDNPDGLPVVAVVLIDDGTLEQGPQVAASLPFATTVVLDPLAPDAELRAAAYTEAGVETAALARLPEGATATDAAVALEASFAVLPGAVALVDAGDGGVAESHEVAQAALSWLGAEGFGLAWLADGGDPVGRVAATSAAPARAILRDLDGAEQDASTIRRFLDNAPMRARQDGAVILIAHLWPETVNALMLWAATARADSVALGPLSAALVEGRMPPQDD